MKKKLLILSLLCLFAFQAEAKDPMRKLEKKMAEIVQNYEEDIQKIESYQGLSPEMKQLKIKQKTEKKDLKIKQLKEKYELKTRQKSERETLRQKERHIPAPQS